MYNTGTMTKYIYYLFKWEKRYKGQQNKGPYFNYVSTFLTNFDQLSNLVSMINK